MHYWSLQGFSHSWFSGLRAPLQSWTLCFCSLNTVSSHISILSLPSSIVDSSLLFASSSAFIHFVLVFFLSAFIPWSSLSSVLFLSPSPLFLHCQPFAAHLWICFVPTPLLSVLPLSSWPCADVGSDRTTWLTEKGWIPIGLPVDIKQDCVQNLKPSLKTWNTDRLTKLWLGERSNCPQEDWKRVLLLCNLISCLKWLLSLQTNTMEY